MKYTEVLEQQKVDFHNVTSFWRGIMIQSVVFIAIFVALSKIQYFQRTFPEYGIYTFYLGMFVILPLTIVLVRYHILRRRIRGNFQVNKQFILLGAEALQLRRTLLAGIVLSDVTMLFGVAHMVLTNNLSESAYLWAIALFFCLNFKPCVRFISCSQTKSGHDALDT